LNSQEPETLLIKNFKKGDAKAFERLFNIYHKRLYAFIFSFTKSKDDSEEIVQISFIKIWENRASYKEKYPFESYLFKIAKNTFLNHIRKQINRHIFEKHFKLFAEISSNTTDGYILFKETQTIIDHIINSMPPRRREIFIMQKMEGLSRKEISKKLNLSVATIDSHLMKANKQITDRLKK